MKRKTKKSKTLLKDVERFGFKHLAAFSLVAICASVFALLIVASFIMITNSVATYCSYCGGVSSSAATHNVSIGASTNTTVAYGKNVYLWATWDGDAPPYTVYWWWNQSIAKGASSCSTPRWANAWPTSNTTGYSTGSSTYGTSVYTTPQAWSCGDNVTYDYCVTVKGTGVASANSTHAVQIKVVYPPCT